MAQDLYRELQQRLDTYSLGFPATETGIEIDILKELFSEEDAQYFLALTPMLETPDAVASRMGKPEEEVADKLEDMSKRGLLFRLRKGEKIRYGAIPFIHGLFEFQVTRLNEKLANMVETYMLSGLKDAVIFSAENFLRVVPVNQSVDVVHNVASFDDASEILKSKDLIVVTDCICRKQKGVIGDSCGKHLEACFMFGSMAQYYLDHDMGRKIDVDEALSIVAKAQEDGLVTQPATAQNPSGMCNCCGDCCGVLRCLNQHPKPAEMVFSNHFVEVDADECVGCEACLDRCQMEALTMVNDIAMVNLDRCIGCGLCVTTCPSGAMRLVPKDEGEIRVPPKNSMEQMMTMAQKRGIL